MPLLMLFIFGYGINLDFSDNWKQGLRMDFTAFFFPWKS